MCRNENPILHIQARYFDIYSRTYIAAHYPFGIHPHIHQTCIHGCTCPQLSTFIYTCVKHVNIPVTTANTPLDRRLDGHALTAHTYRSVVAYRSTHYHSSKWHPYNFTPYGRRKENKHCLPWRRGIWSIHYHLSKWHPYNCTPYGRRKGKPPC